MKQYLFSSIIKDTNIKALNQLPSAFEFFINKSIMWQHEHEYRVFCPNHVIFSIQEIDRKKLPSKEKAKQLQELRFQYSQPDKFKFINFDKEFLNIPFFKYAEPLTVTLPFPKKIYLGWNYKIDENITQFKRIKIFCKKNNIQLYKLTGSIDYDKAQFDVIEIKINK